MTDDLSTRLLAAIERKEDAANQCAGAPWTVDLPRCVHVTADRIPENLAWGKLGYVAGTSHDADAVHIALNDPESVLRLCQAHREIVEMYVAATNDRRPKLTGLRDLDHASAMGRITTLGLVLMRLAIAYGIQEQGGDRA